MSRYIDADKLKTIKSIQSADFNSIETIREWIDKQETADVVEVVHCKDCKFYLHTANKCLLTGRYGTFENDFCSDAEEESDV